MKKLVCKTSLEIESALEVAQNLIKNELRYFDGYQLRVLNNGDFGTIDIFYTNCCEITGLETERVIKAIKTVAKIYKGVFFSLCAEKYFVERLNNYLYRPVFHLAIPKETDKKKK